MLTKQAPFNAQNHIKLLHVIKTTRPRFPASICVSKECQDLVFRLLQVNPHKRMTAQQFFQHEWVCEAFQDDSQNLQRSSNLMDSSERLEREFVFLDRYTSMEQAVSDMKQQSQLLPPIFSAADSYLAKEYLLEAFSVYNHGLSHILYLCKKIQTYVEEGGKLGQQLENILLHLRKSFNQYSKDAHIIQQELQRRGKPLHSQPETHPSELLYNFGLQMVKNAAVDSLVGISKNSSQQIFQAERIFRFLASSQKASARDRRLLLERLKRCEEIRDQGERKPGLFMHG